MRTIKPLRDLVMVDLFEKGNQTTKSGIIVIDDNMTERGIRERWGRVFKVGPKAYDVKEGQWILIDHARWSHGFNDTFDGKEASYRWVDYKDILIVQDERPEGINVE